jgi:hypothetical protein
MDSIITFFCIVGLCIFMYGYIRMRQINKYYPLACNVLYLPRHDRTVKDILPHMEVLEHEEHDSKFEHTRFSTAPMGQSEIENIIPSLNRIYDSVELREMGN